MEKLQVVFDDGCPSCTAGKDLAERLDKHRAIEFIGMNTPQGKQIISKYNLDMSRSAYAILGNSISGKSEMMRLVLSRDGVVGTIISIPFRIPWLSDKLYDLLALHRTHVTKTTAK